MKIQTFDPPGGRSGVATGREGGIPPSRRRTEVPSTLFFALIPSLLFVIWLVLLRRGNTLDDQGKVFDILLKIVTISAAIIGATLISQSLSATGRRRGELRRSGCMRRFTTCLQSAAGQSRCGSPGRSRCGRRSGAGSHAPDALRLSTPRSPAVRASTF